ncbi:8-oxo-dGTP diphosphatase [Tersicoccus sp. Bi-70]|uniref:8-oxo-dGTP diphosphatase n=1 Tax=Tersicoccus sp. Bi-70 TaxID=1897634 RepID=UPI001E54756B|nr:8-oxo-dGTP diphosphatase [Tersicoccus sp. Bi-70]
MTLPPVRVPDLPTRESLTPIALCFPLRAVDGVPEVLLGLKKTGFGTGRMVGLGGHVEPGESDAEAACRELAEESGLVTTLEDVALAGVVDFHFPARPAWSMATALFTTHRWTGDLTESTEIAPAWFPHRALPVERMWADAEHWVPRMLAGERLHTVVVLADDNTTVRAAWSVPLAP